MSTPEERLSELGIALPDAPTPAAVYVPAAAAGELLFMAGQVATADGRLLATGKLGAGVDVDTGLACARQCAINLLAQVKAALGDLGRVERVVKLTVFVASDPSFTEQHVVANGASQVFVDVFGEAGRHARSAIGVPALPTDTPVEVEAVLQAR